MSSHRLDITEFDFEDGLPDADHLTNAWLPEIEEAARAHISDVRFHAFLVAAIRLGAATRGTRDINVMKIVEKAGYSRATFFRLFEGYTSFLLTGYQLVSSLSVDVFQHKLEGRNMSIDEFSRFTANIFYGANCTVPNEISQMLWEEHDKSHSEFHPHLDRIAPIIARYLRANPETSDLKVDEAELDGVIKNLDWDMLRARIDPM